MTAPVAAKITLPDDSGNAGPKVRSQTRVVGGNTVHEHFFVPNSQYTIVSRFFFVSAQQTVQASAHNGTSSGFFWLQNPSGATVTAVLRSIQADANAGSALATPTAPMIEFTKFTFTGTASGASVAVLPWQTGASTNQMICRSAMTGMTVTLLQDVGMFHVPSAETGVGALYGTKEVYVPDPLGFIRGRDLEIGPGEGIVIWQGTAGTSADTRKVCFTMTWDEVDLS